MQTILQNPLFIPLAVTVVIIAVVGSVAAQWSGAYGSRVQMSQALASDYWNLYQARSVKGHLLEVTTNVLAKAGNSSDPEIQKMLKEYGKEVARYDQGKEESQKIAKAYEEDRDAAAALGKKLGPSLPLFSVSIAMASMCLLTKKKPLWLVAILAAAFATVIMVSTRLAEAPPKGPEAVKAYLPARPSSPQEKHAGTN